MMNVGGFYACGGLIQDGFLDCGETEPVCPQEQRPPACRYELWLSEIVGLSGGLSLTNMVEEDNRTSETPSKTTRL